MVSNTILQRGRRLETCYAGETTSINQRTMRNDGPDQKANGSTGLKGANYPDKPTNRRKATEMNRENMSGPTGPGPPRRQRNAGNTNPMACQDCRDTETSTSRTKGPPIKRRDLGKQGRGPTGPLS